MCFFAKIKENDVRSRNKKCILALNLISTIERYTEVQHCSSHNKVYKTILILKITKNESKSFLNRSFFLKDFG